MTLNGRFTLSVHYYELPLRHYLLLIYCSLFTPWFTRDQQRTAGSGVADCEPLTIWNPLKNCGLS